LFHNAVPVLCSCPRCFKILVIISVVIFLIFQIALLLHYLQEMRTRRAVAA
jgi:hypothetical protein